MAHRIQRIFIYMLTGFNLEKSKNPKIPDVGGPQVGQFFYHNWLLDPLYGPGKVTGG